MSLDPRSLVHQTASQAALDHASRTLHVVVTGDEALTQESRAVAGLTAPPGVAQLEQENQSLAAQNEQLRAEIKGLREGPTAPPPRGRGLPNSPNARSPA